LTVRLLMDLRTTGSSGRDSSFGAVAAFISPHDLTERDEEGS
jgi:hypothetical protein